MLYLVLTYDHGMQRLKLISSLRVLRWRLSCGWEVERWDEMGEVIIRSWYTRKLSVQVNLLFQIHQILPLIRQACVWIRSNFNLIRQVVPLISYIHLYHSYHLQHYLQPLFRIHNCTIIAEHKVKSSFSIYPYHNHELTLSTALTDYRIH